MPRTIVQKMTGLIIIFTRLTKPVPSGFSCLAKSGAAKPTAMPSPTATTTATYSQWVRSRRRLVVAEPGSGAVGSCRDGAVSSDMLAASSGTPGTRRIGRIRRAHPRPSWCSATTQVGLGRPSRENRSAESVDQLRGQPGVTRRSELGEPALDVGGQAQPRDEGPQCGPVDPAPAGELLEPLVRLLHARRPGDARGAHGGLPRLAEHLPVLVQVAGHGLRDGVQTGQPPPHVVDREQRV